MSSAAGDRIDACHDASVTPPAMTVTQLWRFPVKSMIGERLDTADVHDLGIDGDRQWGVVDLDTDLVLTARRIPELLLAEPRDLQGARKVCAGQEEVEEGGGSVWFVRYKVDARKESPTYQGT